MIEKLPTKLSRYLLYKRLLYKYYYKFMFLHKPLCMKYRENTLIIFNMYVCRSCLLLYTGFFIALIQSFYFSSGRNFVLTGAGIFLTFLITYPSFYKHFSRRMKDFVRYFDGYFLCMLFVSAFAINIYVGFLSILGFIALRDFYNKKRSGDLVCKGCEKLLEEKTCEGYILQKKALLALDEEYSTIIMKKITEGI